MRPRWLALTTLHTWSLSLSMTSGPDSAVASQIPLNPGSANDSVVLHYKHAVAGRQVKEDTELRILPLGDSITQGYLSNQDGGNGDGYRRQLAADLCNDNVTFAGTKSSGTMHDGYYAAWDGKTIQYISDHADPSLAQRPNIVLLAAGTNDMNPSPAISTEGNDPVGAAGRLGKLIDKIVEYCPDATVLVAIIISTCDSDQEPQTEVFQRLIPGIVKKRSDNGQHVLAVDFTTFSTDLLKDCIHPTNEGYTIMGDYWYDFITQIPSDWIHAPVGKDPTRSRAGSLRPSSWLNGCFVLVTLLVNTAVQVPCVGFHQLHESK